jgi:ribosomal protein S12 methylthiotransferase
MSPQLASSRKWRVGLLSLGCPKTLVDSELILGKLDPERYDLVSNITECDVALLNTCAFIHDAQEESIDQILRLIDLKREGTIKKVVVVGCLVQRFAPELQKELKEVDAFVGSGEYAKIPEIVERVTRGEQVAELGVPGYLYTSGERRVSLTPPYFRYLKVSEGCDHSCSFCVIPSFRGRHRSRRLEDIVEEAKRLVGEGARELVLTGQDTTFFGYDLEGRYLLPQLLKSLNQIRDLRWIRILYAYPSLVTDELIDSIASLEKVCHYLDLPLQHVSDRILKSMRRGTTRESTRRLIRKLRERIPDIAIRTTFIVGYPGEGEGEYQEILEFMQEASFERLGIFTYSPEEGSLAAGLPGQVSEKVKEKRLESAMLLQQTVSRENNRRLLGRSLEVLVEKPSDEDPEVWAGRTYMDAPEVDGTVFLKPGPRALHPGDFVEARITETREYDLIGEVLKLQPA